MDSMEKGNWSTVEMITGEMMMMECYSTIDQLTEKEEEEEKRKMELKIIFK